MNAKPTLARVADYQRYAEQTMPQVMYEIQFGAANDFVGLNDRGNVAGFERLALRPRILRDTSTLSLSTTVQGIKIDLPIMLAPVGVHIRAHPEGELASVRAAGSMGTVMALSTHSSYSIEAVAASASAPIWFQLYFLKERALTEMLVRRAERAGYSGLLLTVDMDVLPGFYWRERDWRYIQTEAQDKALANFRNDPLAERFLTLDADSKFDLGWQKPDLDWRDVEWLKSITSMPVIVKGIQTAEDASLCLEHKVAGLVVSNHGGHAIEGASATIDLLPEVVAAVEERVEVYLDGGVRRGTDVLKALALGAKAVFIGRPIYWGLAVDGEMGVKNVLEIFRKELAHAMSLCGVPDASRVDRSLVSRQSETDYGPHSNIDRLLRLADLTERGYLTRQEFEEQKARLLGRRGNGKSTALTALKRNRHQPQRELE